MTRRGRATGEVEFTFDGGVLRQLRRARGYELTPFAAAVGKSSMMIVKYESGATTPSTSIVCRMAAILECSPADLFCRVADQGLVQEAVMP
jgi:transcriptional regulator with XRE-family HTH domain